MRKKFDLYEQFSPMERAELLLGKYTFEYIKFTINGMIKQTRKNDEAVACNYWNEVAIEIKKLKQ
jgi:hypothetical protein